VFNIHVHEHTHNLFLSAPEARTKICKRETVPPSPPGACSDDTRIKRFFTHGECPNLNTSRHKYDCSNLENFYQLIVRLLLHYRNNTGVAKLQFKCAIFFWYVECRNVTGVQKLARLELSMVWNLLFFS
jgi:hypothetical protein